MASAFGEKLTKRIKSEHDVQKAALTIPFLVFMDDYLKCEKCPQVDHEGAFCRCEDRNIRIAKEQRSRKESPWMKDSISK